MRNSIQTILFAVLLAGAPGVVSAQLTVTGVEPAPSYDSLLPPPAGGTYVDPIFGATIQRVSDALNTHNADRGGFLSWIENEYSTASPFNNDNSKFILVHQSYFALYDGAGYYLSDLPLEINSASEPRWSRNDLATLYYHSGNQLKTYNVSTGQISVVHAFGEYSSITGAGEMDISLDGDHFVFVGDNHEVFVYQISTDSKSPVYSLDGHGFDSVYITPDNHVSITWRQSGAGRFTGIELFDANMNFLRQIAHAGGHMHYTRDADGAEVLVWTNSADPQPIANCQNGIVKILLADASQTCLAQLDWSLAVHISAPDGNGYVFVDTEAPRNPEPDSISWKPYTNEILQIKLDGSAVIRLAHHRSRAVNSYNWEPKISVSRDGSRLLYASDFDLQAINGNVPDYGDTYLMIVSNPN